MGTELVGGETPPAGPVVTMSEVQAWSAQGRCRLAERGIYTRDLGKRLQWKRSRGIDTSAEERFVRYLDSVARKQDLAEPNE